MKRSIRRRTAEGKGGTQVKLTKLASCAGCGAMLEGFRTHTDPRLIVGYDKSDDACVYVVDPQTALVQTTDFFSPPLWTIPFYMGRLPRPML